MKFLFILLLSFLVLLNADEIQRIESIVNDISKLRSDYVKSQNSLVEMKVRLEEEKKETKILKENLKNYKNKILSLENEIRSLKKSLKTKEKNKIICKKTPPKIVKNTIIIKKYLNTQGFKEDNIFPNLLMKEQYKKNKTKSMAHTYRVKLEAKIYDAVNGREIDTWEKSTSFTSNEQTSEWIKITGYFVDKLWRASEKEMWIKSCDALKREQ